MAKKSSSDKAPQADENADKKEESNSNGTDEAPNFSDPEDFVDDIDDEGECVVIGAAWPRSVVHMAGDARSITSARSRILEGMAFLGVSACWERLRIRVICYVYVLRLAGGREVRGPNLKKRCCCAAATCGG